MWFFKVLVLLDKPVLILIYFNTNRIPIWNNILCTVCSLSHPRYSVCQSSNTWLVSCVPIQGATAGTGKFCIRLLRTEHRRLCVVGKELVRVQRIGTHDTKLLRSGYQNKAVKMRTGFTKRNRNFSISQANAWSEKLEYHGSCMLCFRAYRLTTFSLDCPFTCECLFLP
jgi:hypothetical protein